MPLNLRHELKYFISPLEYQVLSRALSRVLVPDSHGDEKNEYHIRSLYFDTVFNDALSEKISGVPNRNKYRIRIYNFSDRAIHFECKSKLGSLISKRSVAITRDLCEQLIASDPSGLEFSGSGVLADMYREMRTSLMHPVVIVDYLREAYLHPAEEVRITFDKQLRTGLYSVDLFNPYLPTLPVLDGSEMVLEVKYNRELPSYIAALLSSCAGNATRSAVSKYLLCRRYEMKNF